MLMWHHICVAMVSLIAQCSFKIVNVSQQRCPCICFDKFAIIAMIFDLLLLHSDLIISSDCLILLLLYQASLDYVLGCSQLNWPWHSKQCSLAPQLFHFPFMRSCWCSIVLVITIFLCFTYVLCVTTAV